MDPIVGLLRIERLNSQHLGQQFEVSMDAARGRPRERESREASALWESNCRGVRLKEVDRRGQDVW